MADKVAHIKHWILSAEESWKDAEALFLTGRYLAVLFYWHLVIEKLLKAHWVKDNLEDVPPRTHQLVRLLEQTHLKLTEEQIALLRIMNLWNLEGRYPDIEPDRYKMATKEYIEERKGKVESLRTCLIEELH